MLSGGGHHPELVLRQHPCAGGQVPGFQASGHVRNLDRLREDAAPDAPRNREREDRHASEQRKVCGGEAVRVVGRQLDAARDHEKQDESEAADELLSQ